MLAHVIKLILSDVSTSTMIIFYKYNVVLTAHVISILYSFIVADEIAIESLDLFYLRAYDSFYVFQDNMMDVNFHKF